MYFGMPAPCGGGVLALDGKTGDLLWQRWMQTSILKLDCTYDVTQDDVNDCLVSGESGLLCIVNGKTGEVTWCLVHNEGSLFRGGILDFYAGQFIPDVNGDGVVDVITAHTNGSSAAMMGSHVMILSGRSGEVLHTLTSPVSGEMMLSAPHLLVKPDGETVVIFCTVHNNAPTSIYVIALSGLINGESNRVKTIFSDIQGLTASPILIDMNDDQTEDIVVTSKSKLLIFNGLNYSLLLNVSYPFDDSYEHDIQFYPVPGYFNNDSIPDLFLTYSVGSTEFLYYSVSTVLDGKTGKSLLPAPIVRSNIADTAGITLSSPGYGNDAFIYWMSSCVNFETNQDDYKLSGRSFEVDICNARFNTSTEIKLMLLSQHVPSPGIVLYSSSKNFESEINGTANVLAQVEEYIKLHPNVKKDIEMYQMSKLNNSPAKCTAALAAIQRNEASGYYVPNPFEPEIIPDPVQRAYDMSRDRYPAGDSLNVEPEFLSPDEDTRDRDERDEQPDKNQPTLSDNNQPPSPEEKDPSSTEVDISANDMDDLSNSPERTRNVVKEIEDKSKLSKEVMPRKKRNSNKILPRRKRKIGNIEIDTHIDNADGISYYQDDFTKSDANGNGIESLERRENSFQDKPGRNEDEYDDHGRLNDIDYTTKLDSEQNYKNKHKELATKIGTTETDDENHGAEEFDDYGDEMGDRINVETKETNDDDSENHGGETIDDYGEYKEEEVRGENKIRHEQKYRNREREMREEEAPSKTEKAEETVDNIETNVNGGEMQTENNREEYHRYDNANGEQYSDKQEVKKKEGINLESVNRIKRHKGRESVYDESEEDDTDEEDDDDDDDDFLLDDDEDEDSNHQEQSQTKPEEGQDNSDDDF
uniref:FAM234A/B beta-propeller domain-containing protein n=1 Tax=Cacopsylla melanoneura TaxID=428564 RepID=A0A8D9DY37_9HEMI